MQAQDLQGIDMILGGTAATAGAALTGISGAATTFSTSAFNFIQNGIFVTKAAVSGGATPTTDIRNGLGLVLQANQGAAAVFGVDNQGNVQVMFSPVETLDAAGNFLAAPRLPAFSQPPVVGYPTNAGGPVDGSSATQGPDFFVPFGIVLLKNGSTGSAWTFGTSNWT